MTPGSAESVRVKECVCVPPLCGGADLDPDEPGYCKACADLDPEEHCLRCPFECCWMVATAESGRGRRYLENDLARLLHAVEDALRVSPSDSPTNDEPFALQADGYHYWRLRHAYEAIVGPLHNDGTESDG